MEDVKHSVLTVVKELSEKSPTTFHHPGYITNLVIEKYGYDRNAIIQAIIFLYDDGFLKREKRGESVHYRLSSKGHQEFTPTKYTRSAISSTTINYQTGGIGVYGAGNNFAHITQTTITNINEIDKIIHLINSSNMEEAKKRDTILDADTLKNELAKSKPDQTVLSRAWNTIVENAKFINNASEIFKVLSLLYPVVKSLAPSLPDLPLEQIKSK